ncbi:MAG: acyltransferase, partial [Candidatus Nanopelagicales bacterium]
YLDNLKIVLVASVILGHAFITYSELGSWAYRDPSDNDVFNLVAAVFVALGSLFAMGLFFLVAGLLTPGPVRRKGPAGFLRDRAVRLGVPFLAYALLVFPLVTWAGEREHPFSWYLRDQLTDPDPGPLWFVGVLLLFSLVYVAWRTVRPAPPPADPPAPDQPGLGRLLVVLALAIAVGSFVLRLQFPVDSPQILSAHVWQWPQCIGLFVLGLLAAERGWLQPVAPGLRRAGGWAAGAGALVMMASIATAPSADPFAGGPTWQSALTSACEGAIAVGLSVWLLGVFQRRFDHAGALATALGRAAFGAYVLQAPVLVTFALLASTLSVAPEVRFLIVAPAGVAGSFALSWLLTRVPGVRRIL